MINRRTFIGSVAVGLLAGPLPAQAQQAGKMWRIGFLDQGSASANRPYFEAFRDGLRDLGWIEGKNIKVGLMEPRLN